MFRTIVFRIRQFILKILIFGLKGYRYCVSPVLGNRCRFYPSCSIYALNALEVYGLGKGSWMALKRLGRCHPFHPGGYDPVIPEKRLSL
jgi:uncharacterized protein